MYRIFVDTCVWWHWLTHRAGIEITNPDLIMEVVCFDEIYQVVRNRPAQFVFLHNRRIELELGHRFSKDFFELVLPLSTSVPLPLTRYDGAYCHDGSILYGGECGGSLRDLLYASGRNHEVELRKAHDRLRQGEPLYKSNARKREFDVEHLESALEAKADIFITNDVSTIITPIKNLAKSYTAEDPVYRIGAILKTPADALKTVRLLLV